MTRVLPIVLVISVIMLSAGVAAAEGLGRLGVFGDTGGIDCGITPPASGLFQIHLVHIGSDGATAFQFSSPPPSCLNATYLNDIPAFSVVLGNTQTGIAIAYGACLTGDFLVCSMQFLSLGTSPECCKYVILKDPREDPPAYYVADCEFNTLPGNVKAGVINKTAACQCDDPWVPAEESNWGKIKALYSGE
jgi:hypothetical protein